MHPTARASRLRRLVLAVALAAGLGSAGCLGPGFGTIRSQVVNAQTGQPIAGAVVLGVWTTYADLGLMGHGGSKLVGVREVETDTEGKFTLERPGARARDESVTVYKFGYVVWNNQDIFLPRGARDDPAVPAVIRLDPFPGGGNREQHQYFISNSIRGGFGRESAPKFFNAIGQERQRP